MCLWKITAVDPNPSDKVVKAWKNVFYQTDGQYRGMSYGGALKRGEWMKAERKTLYSEGPLTPYAEGPVETYESGFHCFPSKRDARRHWSSSRHPSRTIRVEVRGIETRGVEYNSYPPGEDSEKISVLVAREMRIPEAQG